MFGPATGAPVVFFLFSPSAQTEGRSPPLVRGERSADRRGLNVNAGSGGVESSKREVLKPAPLPGAGISIKDASASRRSTAAVLGLGTVLPGRG